jgi:preprotein translocase subunit SecA
MNRQRELIYTQRNRVLDGEDIKETVRKMMSDTVDSAISTYLVGDIAEDWNFDGLRAYFNGWLFTENDFKYSTEELNKLEKADVEELIKAKIDEVYTLKEQEFGDATMREVERVMLLRSVDTHWMDHIDAMDELRQGIGLRAYGQHDPVVEYRNEGYDMFNAMTESIREETVKRVLTVKVRREEGVERKKVAEESGTSSGDNPKNRTVKGKGAVGKNALCPCGSGLKYKRCCGKDKE